MLIVVSQFFVTFHKKEFERHWKL